jgi:homoserine kinase type II
VINKEMIQIPQVISFFQAGPVRNATQLTEGTANLNFLVTTLGNRELIVKFPVNQTRESLQNDIAIQEQLSKAGLRSSTYLHTADGRFVYDEGKSPAVVSTHIDGIHPQEIDEDISHTIGNVLARFHEAVTILPIERDGWLNPVTTNKLTTHEDDPLTQQARRYLATGANLYDKDLPSGIIHGDLDPNNLLLNRDDPTKVEALLDFEETEKNVFIVDIARTMVRVCVDKSGKALDKNLMRSFLEGYAAIRLPTQEEFENMPNAIKWVSGAAMLWYIENGSPELAENAIARAESLKSFTF